MTLLLLLSCTGSCVGSTPDTEVLFGEPEVRAVSADFHDNPAGSLLPPDQAFVVRELCPIIERAALEPDQDGLFAKLTVEGRRLARVQTVGAVMLDGELANSIVHPGGEEALTAAVGCRNCRLMLGFEYEGLTVACLGPGHSLTVERGRLVEPAAPQ